MKVWLGTEEVMELQVEREEPMPSVGYRCFEVPEEILVEYFRAEENLDQMREALLEEIPDWFRSSL